MSGYAKGFKVSFEPFHFVNLTLKIFDQRHKCMATTTDYRRTMKPFFIEIPNLWAWADNLGRQILRHLGYFWPNYQDPF